jgi:hypothetical protein|nr:hypothetical protein [Bifidobacterium dentium]DAK62040.1 MAG TPA: hypothetical protein [Caudoviricetes sp.]
MTDEALLKDLKALVKGMSFFCARLANTKCDDDFQNGAVVGGKAATGSCIKRLNDIIQKYEKENQS